MKDRVDLVELIKAGLDVGAARAFHAEHAPSLLSKLDECEAAARAQE